MSTSSRTGAGRGVKNVPAWMSRQQQNEKDGPGGGDGPGPGGKDSGGGGGNRDEPRGGGGGPGGGADRDRDRYGRGDRGPPPPDRGGDRYGRGPPPGRGPGRRGSDRDRYSPRGGGRYGDDPYRDDPRGPPRGGRGPPPRDGYGREPPPPRRGSRDDRYRDDRGGPPRRGSGGGRPRPADEGLPVFRSELEEREWAEERRRKRRARRSLFDVEPTPEELARMEKQRQALEILGGGTGGVASAKQAAAASGSGSGGGGIYGPASDSYESGKGGKGGGGGGGLLQPQQTRHARRLYIGHLPEGVHEQELHDFFRGSISTALSSSRNYDSSEDPILSVYINKERRFAFVEFKTMEMCTSCLALDGINVNGRGVVKVKRPNDYNAAAVVGGGNPAGMADFDVSKLGIISGSVPDSPNKIFIGGLPYHLNEQQVQELLAAFGQIRAFHLVKNDPTAVTSKGYCFVEYADPNNTTVAVTGLNGMDMGGGKVLSARVASARGTVVPGSGKLEAQVQAQQMAGHAVSAAVGGAGVGVDMMSTLGGGDGAAATAVDMAVGGATAIPEEMRLQVEALLDAAFAGGTNGAAVAAAAAAASCGGGAAVATPSDIADAAASYLAQALPPAGMVPNATPAAAVAPPLGGAASATEMANAALDAAFAGIPSANGMATGVAAVPAPPTAASGQPTIGSLVPGQPPLQQRSTTRVLVLLNMVTDGDLATDEDYADLFDEVKDECAKFGNLVSMKIPRPQDGYAPSATRKIFLEYGTEQDAEAAERELAGRQFGSSVVETSYFDEHQYQSGLLA